MRRDPLLALTRLRRLALAAAERELAARQQAAARAAERHEAAKAALRQEGAAAATLQAEGMTGAYGSWLALGLDATREAAARLAQSERETAEARRELAGHRAAKRAVDLLLEQRAAERRAEAARREQATLDEHAQRRPTRP